MDRRVSPLVALLISVAIAGVINALVLADADPAFLVLANGGAVLLAHMYFFRESEL